MPTSYDSWSIDKDENGTPIYNFGNSATGASTQVAGVGDSAIMAAQTAQGIDQAQGKQQPPSVYFTPPPKLSLEERGATAANDAAFGGNQQIGFLPPMGQIPASAKLDAYGPVKSTDQKIGGALFGEQQYASMEKAKEDAKNPPKPNVSASNVNMGTAPSGSAGDNPYSVESVGKRLMDQQLAGTNGGPVRVTPAHWENGSKQFQNGPDNAVQKKADDSQLAATTIAAQEMRNQADIGDQVKYEKMGITEFDKAHSDTSKKYHAAYIADQESRIADIDNTKKELAEMKVDDGHFWKTRNTGEKIGLVLAAFMGGYASSRNGGPNHALNIINSSIDRDIDAQKSNIEKKRGDLTKSQEVYKTAYERFKNKEDAHLVTINAYKQGVISKIESLKAQATTDEQRAKADQAIAQQQADIDKNWAQISAGRNGTQTAQWRGEQRSGGSSGPNLKGALETALKMGEYGIKAGAEKGKEHVLVGPDGNAYPVRRGIPEATVTTAQKQLNASNIAKKTLSEAKKQGAVGRALGFGKHNRSAIASFVNQSIDAGVMNESEGKRMMGDMESLVPGVADKAFQDYTNLVDTVQTNALSITQPGAEPR